MWDLKALGAMTPKLEEWCPAEPGNNIRDLCSEEHS